jgi:hypothetical protein
VWSEVADLLLEYTTFSFCVLCEVISLALSIVVSIKVYIVFIIFLILPWWTVHGSEYSFGAHDYPTSGVFEVEPKNCPGFLYRSTIFIGRTSLQPLEFRDFIQRMASEYHGDTYHLISKNCNHFTDDLSTRLTGKPIPGWVNRLAKIGNNSSPCTSIYFSLLMSLCF